MTEIARRAIVVAGLTVSLHLWWQTLGALWAWLVPVTVLVSYALVPWPRFDRRTAHLDRRRAVWPVDVGATVTMALAATLIHRVLPQNAWTALISTVGGGLLALPPFVWAARNTTYAVRAEADRLIVTSWRGDDEWVYGDVRRVTPLIVRGRPCGVVLWDASGEELRLDWTRLVRADVIRRAIESVGLCVVTSSPR